MFRAALMFAIATAAAAFVGSLVVSAAKKYIPGASKVTDKVGL